MTGELNQQEINNILCSQAIGRIASCDGKHPYIVPVVYSFDGTHIYAQTYEGKKLETMRQNPNVCFQVDISNDIFNWQSVIVYGQFEEISRDKLEEIRAIHFSKVLPLMTGSTIHQHEHDEGKGHELKDPTRIKPVMFRILINERSGRFEKR